jgi:hypothetical protein
VPHLRCGGCAATALAQPRQTWRSSLTQQNGYGTRVSRRSVGRARSSPVRGGLRVGTVARPHDTASSCHRLSGAQNGAGGEFQRILSFSLAHVETEGRGQLVPSGGITIQ